MEIPRTDTEAVNELIKYSQWVYHGVHVTDDGVEEFKIPFQGNGRKASPTKSKTWGDYDTVCNQATKRSNSRGMGFVLSEADPYCAIDLDKVWDPENKQFTNAKAKEIIEKINSYTEFSPSGTGFHIWVKAVLDAKGRRQGFVEIYDRTRYMTVTGKHFEGTPETIEPRQSEIAQLLISEFSKEQKKLDVIVIDKDDIDTFPLVFDDYARAPGDKLQILMHNNTKFHNSWNLKRKDMGGNTPSEYDFSLMYHAIDAGWEPQEIYDMIIQHRVDFYGKEAVAKLDPNVHRSYFRESYKNARQSVANNRGDITPEINKAMNGTSQDKLDLFLEKTHIKIDKVIMTGEDPAIVQFVIGDKTLTIGTTIQLGNINLVRMKLLEVVGKSIPTDMRVGLWHRIMEMLVAVAERRDDKVLTKTFATLTLVKDYMENKMPKSDDWKEDAEAGAPFIKTHTHDFEKGIYFFWNMQNFRKYIYYSLDTRLSSQEMALDLSKSGCRYTKIGFRVDGKSIGRNLWCIKLEDLINGTDVSCNRPTGDWQDDLLSEAGDESSGELRDEVNSDMLPDESGSA